MIRNLLAAGSVIFLANLGKPVLADMESISSDELTATLPEKITTNVDPTGNMEAQLEVLRVMDTQVVNQLTGEDSPNRTAARWDVHGTDLGHMFQHKGKLYIVFGDTFGPRGVFTRRNWRSNVMAKIADPDPRNGLAFEAMIVGPNGKAKELLPSRKINGVEKTVIPTQGISIDDRMYLHYMSVKSWAATGGVWTVGHSGFAYSDNDGQDWQMPAETVWSQATGFEQAAFALKDEVLYTLGIPEGRFGGVRLRRVAPKNILVQNAYEYWDGSQWVADPAASVEIIPAPVGELSVAWSEAHRRWLMMYLDPERHAVVLRTAPALTGPWSEARVVVTQEQYPGLYAPYIVPGTDLDGDVYYTLSQWEPYNVFLMRTALEWRPALVSADDEQPVLPSEAAIPVSQSN